MRGHRRFPWIMGMLLGAVPGISFAAGSGSLSQVQSLLRGKILPWQSIMQTAATDLFYVLAAVEFSVLFLNHVLQKRGHEDLFAGIIKKVVTLGFFLTLLDNSGTWIPDIINGLAGGAHALGVTAVTPGQIATEALQAFLGIVLSPIAAATHNLGNTFSDIFSGNFSAAFSSAGKAVASSNPASLLVETLLAGIIGLLAGMGILVMALEFLMVQIESYLVIALGVIMLAGGGLRWTAKYVGSYFDYAINVGVRLFILTALAYLVTYSIVPLIQTILENVTNPLQAGFEVLILGALIALLPRKASSIASSLLSGNSSFSGGELAKEGGMIAGGTVALAAGGVGLAATAGGGLAAGGLSAAAGVGGGAAGGAASLAGGLTEAAGAGEAGAAAGVAAPEAGAMSAGGGASSSVGAGNAVPAPGMGGSAGGEAPQAARAVQAPAPSTQSTGQQNPSKGVEAPFQEAVKESGQDKRNDEEMSASEPFAGGEPQPDAPRVPVNAVPAPEPVSTPSGGGGQGSTAAPAPKSAVDKLTDSFVNHAKDIAINQSKEKVGVNKLDVGHMRDFD
ncbi:P-type conjugative transfer protein TrbL [Acidithiobacillus thiooxidans]|uniref:P-type conjugative transfer protein TrbL n=4 Tax=Acidithiobacillus thiooxidans TaxID=930 RepID=A0A1C2IQJ6_ACITH|nr:P-type conjugative transfer protein TrbL [Acidithiobacillus thiooxidans]OCX73009.1 P-type conjugative transfer protein TrbL [Acidithiobacillus thiooxidans]OCX75518.1 P-type conjugative transfer protein TrbL [Acidithiobacillus thiooxidans]OCX78293.1 P-type conjugative transfer protein TrbL [Acidithiobacillus thiooxidans]OCX81843.1 P-type conjugative transfer protein TrbL [Acidithiobacillus thiooxidans]OCX82870.1 P-type conjugative transfer protein TrbL [Acidithiobacillus thiooxidans]